MGPGKSVLLHKQIEHFIRFNLVPGSSILDNYSKNYVILKKQLSMPIVLRKYNVHVDLKGLKTVSFCPIF
jgi:hypothetical protein